MNQSNQTPQQSPALVVWVIWGSLIAGLFVMQNILGAGLTLNFEESPEGGELNVVFLAPIGILLLLSSAARWGIIPKLDTIEQMLPVILIGSALAEGSAILGMIFYADSHPALQVILFAVSLVGILQFVPIYLKK